jgi:hypothetical protein
MSLSRSTKWGVQPGSLPQKSESRHVGQVSQQLNQHQGHQTPISVKDHSFLLNYYERIFENFQQINCRTLAKAYIKLIEPRKQFNYPYNGKRKYTDGTVQILNPTETKPLWWPPGVSHREPDHLPKTGKYDTRFRH